MTPPMTSEAELKRRVWQELQRATHDRHHEWRTPMLTSTGLEGTPQARTLVLRRAAPASWQLTFYTDSRSNKVLELQKNPQATVAFWSKRLGWQIRLQASVTVLTEGPEVTEAWCELYQSPSAGDYLSLAAPGSPLALQANGPGRSKHHHLALLQVQVTSLDWLELASVGHRRALMTPTTLDWRVP